MSVDLWTSCYFYLFCVFRLCWTTPTFITWLMEKTLKTEALKVRDCIELISAFTDILVQPLKLLEQLWKKHNIEPHLCYSLVTDGMLDSFVNQKIIHYIFIQLYYCVCVYWVIIEALGLNSHCHSFRHHVEPGEDDGSEEWGSQSTYGRNCTSIQTEQSLSFSL